MRRKVAHTSHELIIWWESQCSFEIKHNDPKYKSLVPLLTHRYFQIQWIFGREEEGENRVNMIKFSNIKGDFEQVSIKAKRNMIFRRPFLIIEMAFRSIRKNISTEFFRRLYSFPKWIEFEKCRPKWLPNLHCFPFLLVICILYQLHLKFLHKI